MSDNFLDSSILVYQMDETDAAKQRVADDLVFGGMRDGSAVISFQVVQETLSVLTGKLAIGIAEHDRDRFLPTSWCHSGR